MLCIVKENAKSEYEYGLFYGLVWVGLGWFGMLQEDQGTTNIRSF